jgi:Putative transposase
MLFCQGLFVSQPTKKALCRLGNSIPSARNRCRLKIFCRSFVQRFCQHILPKDLVRIRHYGILTCTWNRARLPALQEKLGQKQTAPKEKTQRVRPCKFRTPPGCKTGSLQTILSFDQRGPSEGRLPEFYQEMWNKLNRPVQA